MGFPAKVLSLLWTQMEGWVGGSEDVGNTGVGDEVLASLVTVTVVAPREKAT